KSFSRSNLTHAVVEFLDLGSGRVGAGEHLLYSVRATEPAPFKLLAKLPGLPAPVVTNARLGYLVHEGLYELKGDKRALEELLNTFLAACEVVELKFSKKDGSQHVATVRL